MITRSVTIEEIDELFLLWHQHINASALYRQALREEMDVRGVDPKELRHLLEQAHEQEHTFEEIAENTDRFADLESLVESVPNQSLTEESTNR